jgi:putative hemolysin
VTILFECGIVLLLVLLNAFFAMSELAIVSSRRPRLQKLAERGHRGAAVALRLSEDPTQFLSAVQIGITLIGIIAGAYSGATLAEPFAAALRESFPLLGTLADNAALVIVVSIITYLSLVVGELVPKRIAMNHAEGIAVVVSRPIALLARIGTPLVWLLQRSTELLVRLLGGAKEREGVTHEEVKTLIAEGAEQGGIEPAERHMLEGVFALGDLTVRAIMTPRPDVEWLSKHDAREDVLQSLSTAKHSRLLLCGDELDDIVGMVRMRDLINQLAAGQAIDLEAACTQVLSIHETTTALRLLELFRNAPSHLAVVLDEYGSLEGVVTPSDVLSAVTGRILESSDEATNVVKREDGSWLVDGRVRVLDAERAVGAYDWSGKSYTTVAGLVLDRLGRVPKTGERVTVGPFTLEVVDMDGRRIDKLLISRAPDE